MLLIPLEGEAEEEDVLLYLRPMYVEASGSQPAVQQIIAAYGERVRICASVELVLGALLVPDNQVGDDCGNVTPIDLGRASISPIIPIQETEEPPAETQTPTETPITGETNLEGLLAQAQQAFANANEALANGDLGRYQELIDEGQQLVQQATELLEADNS